MPREINEMEDERVPSPSQFIGIGAMRRFNFRKFSASNKEKTVVVPDSGDVVVVFTEHGHPAEYVSKPLCYVTEQTLEQHPIYVDEINLQGMKIRAHPGTTIRWCCGGYIRNTAPTETSPLSPPVIGLSTTDSSSVF
jgi:hypothetical protein